MGRIPSDLGASTAREMTERMRNSAMAAIRFSRVRKNAVSSSSIKYRAIQANIQNSSTPTRSKSSRNTA